MVNFTVKQLIEHLEKLPPELPVLTHGYKEHFDAVLEPVVENVKYNEENDDICGMFEICDGEEKGSFEAVLLFRNGRF